MHNPTVIIMNDSDVKPAELGFGFTTCHSCATELFIPQKSKIYLFLINLWIGFKKMIIVILMFKNDQVKYSENIKNSLKHGTRVTNVYVCSVCHTRHIYFEQTI